MRAKTIIVGLMNLAMLKSFASTGDAYIKEVQQWREHREAQLKADDGWLTVTGLF
jgi:hypothetical protein